ncbi:iron uptake transporter deferrochelatase/peroxidase subunit [Protaetiibacter larvae]|uniref:Deferrochelatase n=1 Tax=Protaetiibacter larvae TaxID=2592654 RepID=A0A5C1Y719_9MICO|nr:iron uptake transporter deferrochelatase/peroxidase subunit [Protaetiibacter larvae]QEO09611.1 deferrochelatase/peroxidase EfeB [Protaetiibacter larvae]
MTEPADHEPDPADRVAPKARIEITRRGLLGLAGAGAAGIVVGGAAGAGIATAIAGAAASAADRSYDFYGEHQAGITTPVQDRLHFASFDLAEGATRADLESLLADWTAAAASLTRGEEIGETGAVGGSPYAPPEDTGEALGLGPAGLTLTFGFGPSLFVDADGVDRFGLASRKPAALEPLPRFAGDALIPASSGGDLCIQACSDDPQVAVHAIRNLSRIAFGRAALRWSQLGFGRTSSTSVTQQTPRNLFGFKDGTANLKAEEHDAVVDNVWVSADAGPSWMVGGSYLVARRIRMIIESWDRVQLNEQETLVGRTKGDGGPLSGGGEFAAPDFAALRPDGTPKIDAAAHVRLAHPDVNGGIRLLRRGYNFVDGNDSLGRLDAGLFFLSFQNDPERFVTVQRSLARDGLNEYLRHVGSAVFAIPPGIRPGQSIGDGLLN